LCGAGGAGDTVVVPKGQATPDHTISIMSSGDRKPRASASGDRTATVASVTAVGRLFLRDICCARPFNALPLRPLISVGRDDQPLSGRDCHGLQAMATQATFGLAGAGVARQFGQ
jgi:hypothetical protein